MTNTVKANGINIAYRLNGPEEAPVVMLSNSLMSNLSMWDDQVMVLSASYRVLRYDTRGHGGTDAPPGLYSIKLLAADVVALLDALGIDKVHFAGLSMGGMIAQYLGANHGDRLHSLLLCDTASEMPTLEMWNDRIETAKQNGIGALLEGTLSRWFTADFLENDKTAVEKVAQMIRSNDTGGYISCANAVRDMSQIAVLSKISVPTIVIVDDDDPACTLEQSRVVEEHIEGAELVVIKNAAHLANIEQPQKFNDAMMGFLK